MIRMMKSSMFQRSLKTDKFQSYEHSSKESWNTNFNIHENVHYNCDLPKYEVANNIIFTNYSLLTRHFVLTIFSAENNELIARRLDKKLEAIYSTRNRISSLTVFHVLLYRRPSILQDIHFSCRIRWFVFELVEYVCINTQKSRASIGRKFNLLHYRRAKPWWTWSVISFIAEKKRPAHHKTQLHTVNVYNNRPVSLTIEVLLIKIPLF